MEILYDYDLTRLNTFGVSARASFFVEIKNENELKDLFILKEFKENPKLFLGGGSNTLLTEDFKGMVILNKLAGIEILAEENDFVLIQSKSGVLWHDLVSFTVERGYWGIENLAFIPGTVGAAPMQNIGAYGVELKDVLEKVEAYDILTGQKKVFQKEECLFGYRDSIFKNKLKGQYFISAIVLKLNKIPKINITYKILREHLEKNKIIIKNSKEVSEAVTAIRQSKLPDPKIIGNAGSFFKNVLVEKAQLEELLQKWPDLPSFQEGDFLKIPAGWLIEKCGPVNVGTSWKGYRFGNVGVHEKQALVLVNHGGATGREIKNLAEEIIQSVFLKFNLRIETEVNII